MIRIAFDSSFKRAFKQRISENGAREEKFLYKLELFKNDPFAPSLKTHKLSGKLKDYWSFSVEYDLRIIFYFAAQEEFVLIDIGTHKDVY